MSEAAGRLIRPPWGEMQGVRAVATTRLGGLSLPPYATWNLGRRTEDDPARVRANHERLREAAGLPAEPCWLRQVHGSTAVRAMPGAPAPEADAAWTDAPGTVCAVLTADCLPVVIADPDGRCVAVAHAGWRGLAAGVVEAAVAALPVDPGALRAWLGPAIGPGAFEVGPEVRDAFLASDPAAADAFHAARGGRWLANLYLLARQRLCRAGLGRIDGGGLCTYRDRHRFFSHRRDGPATGRTATIAWLEARC
jgi:hypothetical protein